jgi:hypothetical protein
MEQEQKPNDAKVLKDELTKLSQRVDALESGYESDMNKLEIKMDENTEITNRVRDILETADGFFKFTRAFGRLIRWLAKYSLWFMTIWGAIWATMHGGEPPK